MTRSITKTVLLGMFLNYLPCFTLSTRAESQEKRADIPDETSLKDAEKTIKGLFKDDYAKRAPADRVALAKNLLKQGIDTKDSPAARYVLFREAQEIAAKAGDIETAFKAIEEMARTYATNSISLKNGALAAASGAPRTPEEQQVLVLAYLGLAEEAAQERQFDVAAKAAQSALAGARKIKDVPLLARAEAQSKAMSAISEKYDKVKKDMEVLAATPDNPEANQFVGEFECFFLSAWDTGLAKLAKGADPVLKALAAKDLSKPTEGADQASVGDGWWDRAGKETGQSKAALRQRAAHWYEQAIQKLSGLSKVKIEKRLAELKSAESSFAGLTKKPQIIDVLRDLDTKKGLVQGVWKLERGVLFGEGTGDPPRALLQTEIVLPEEYDVTVVLERSGPISNFNLSLVGGGRPFTLFFDAFGGTLTGPCFVDVADPRSGGAVTRDRLLENGKPKSVLVKVRKNSLTIQADGKDFFTWKADWSRVGVFDPQPRDPKVLGVGLSSTTYKVHRLILSPVK